MGADKPVQARQVQALTWWGKVTMSVQDWAIWEQVCLSRRSGPGTHLAGKK
jgi:hypothetical protein